MLATKYSPRQDVIGRVTKFNEFLYNKYDIPAREKLKLLLNNFIQDNPDKFMQDFIILNKSCKYKYLEIQVCASWILPDKYPFSNIFVYARKANYNNNTLFLTLNKNFTCGYLFDFASIYTTNPRRIQKYSREYVYDIEWPRVMYVDLEEEDKINKLENIIMSY